MTEKFKANSKKNFTMDYKPLELEKEIREFWDKNELIDKLMEFREKNNVGILGFYEGPPTLNGVPHIGHARGRVMKDLRYRWKTMQQYFVPFWAGWDCQGLPVELEVEKLLGVKNKRELLERVGEERFIKECKKTILKYHKHWVEADKKLGISINQKKAYWTYLDNYIEREWQYLKSAWDQGLLEEGYYIVAYCPGCQTSLSSAEVGYEGAYKEVEDYSLYFKFRIAKNKKEYFLVWTTMPFTLVTDMMLAVHSEAEYAKVLVGEEKWIIVKGRVPEVMKELGIQNYEVQEVLSGKNLVNLKYDYPFKDIIPKQAELDHNPKVHRVICEDFVDINTATGIVHLSPGNGEEDFFSAKKYEIPIYVPFDDEVKFTQDAGVFSGLFARDADTIVVKELEKRKLLVSAKKIRHEYPTCWRSHHKIIWLARREYFLRTDKINKKIMEAAEKVEYFYEGPKNRFLSFLREGKPWCISRERIWGTPLPIWICDKCKSKILVASKQELLEKALEKPTKTFELHKPWVDRIILKCEECGSIMHREPFVIDTWHNSGASPYARFSDEEFKKFIPADFLSEAMDQTRGWANSLLLEYIILTKKAEAPYKAFLFQGLIQDDKGRKMSKSLGNVIEANQLLLNYSADLCRFYLLRKCSPAEFMSFDVKELRRRPYQILSTLFHLNRFFIQNAEYDKFNPKDYTIKWAEREKQLKKPDIWLLSKLQRTIKEYTAHLEKSEFNFATGELENFVIDILSRLYVPIIRKELWSDDQEKLNRRLAIYTILWHVLRIVILLFNPITPYLSETLYQKIYGKFDSTEYPSVNFVTWPKPDHKLRKESLEEDFEKLFTCTSLIYSARQSAKLKRRWPLSKVIIVASKKNCLALKRVEDILLDLGNVKSVECVEKKPVFITEKADKWINASEGEVSVWLDIERDEELLGEGLMRDLARRVQSLRKDLGYVPTDILNIVYITGLKREKVQLLKPYLTEMGDLVRTITVQLQPNFNKIKEEKWYEYKLNNEKIQIAIS